MTVACVCACLEYLFWTPVGKCRDGGLKQLSIIGKQITLSRILGTAKLDKKKQSF